MFLTTGCVSRAPTPVQLVDKGQYCITPLPWPHVPHPCLLAVPSGSALSTGCARIWLKVVQTRALWPQPTHRGRKPAGDQVPLPAISRTHTLRTRTWRAARWNPR